MPAAPAAFGPNSLRQESSGHSATIRGRVGDGPNMHITSERGSISVRKEGGESGEDKDSGAPVDKSKLEKQLKDLKETEIKLW